MADANQQADISAQGRVARKYRRLGYDVQENPRPNVLPDFLNDATPDIIARSKSDNVVIEVKTHGALKGSNDLVTLAERVSAHPDWRLELVALDEARNGRSSAERFQRITKNVNLAIGMKLYDLAYVYLADVLVGMANELALANDVKSRNISDKGVFTGLGFKGVLPDDLLRNCLNALDARNEFIGADDEARVASEGDVTGVIELCRQLNELL